MGQEHPMQICGVAATVEVIAGRWKPLILWHLHDGTKRFGQLRRLMPDVSEKMLIQQLRQLEADDLVHREVYKQVPPRVEYSMTPLGETVWPVLESMSAWGLKRIERQGGFKSCGEEGPSDLDAAIQRNASA